MSISGFGVQGGIDFSVDWVYFNGCVQKVHLAIRYSSRKMYGIFDMTNVVYKDFYFLPSTNKNTEYVVYKAEPY